jgi:hypothetical protein
MMRRSRTARPILGMLALLALALAPPVFAADDEGFVSLFNGKDLTGWAGDAHWSVEDGAITGRTTPETLLKYNTFLVWQGGKPSDFELRAKYKIVGGNSGIQYRSKILDEPKYVVGGYQSDIDAALRYSGIVYEEKGRGILTQRGEKVTIGPDGKKKAEAFGDKDELRKKINNEDWNELVIVARGNHLTQTINGVKMSEVIDKHSDKAATSGVIALQLHQGPPMTIQFKDIRLKEMK